MEIIRNVKCWLRTVKIFFQHDYSRPEGGESAKRIAASKLPRWLVCRVEAFKLAKIMARLDTSLINENSMMIFAIIQYLVRWAQKDIPPLKMSKFVLMDFYAANMYDISKKEMASLTERLGSDPKTYCKNNQWILNSLRTHHDPHQSLLDISLVAGDITAAQYKFYLSVAKRCDDNFRKELVKGGRNGALTLKPTPPLEECLDDVYETKVKAQKILTGANK